jgi:RNase H-like domain found in reverse transcriptase/Reverse transcriptase (RNA-dependent DNA polymerase)/Integrase zinc binding domain
MRLLITVAKESKETVDTNALLDCGAGGVFMDQKFAERNEIRMTPLRKPILAKNVDRTLNKNSTITHSATIDLTVNERTMKTRCLVTGLGKESIILGLPWLRQHNPTVDWSTGAFEFREEARLRRLERNKAIAKNWRDTMIGSAFTRPPPPTIPTIPMKLTIEEVPEEPSTKEELPVAHNVVDEPTSTSPPSESLPQDEVKDDELVIAYVRGKSVFGIFEPAKEAPLTIDFDEPKFSYSKAKKSISRVFQSISSLRYCFSNTVHIRAKTSMSQKLAHGSAKDQEENKKTLDELLPEQYRDYKRVFEKAASERFPEKRAWDHAIDLKPDFVSRDCKVYPLTPGEQVKLDEFLDENLKKGYIHLSKSPMSSPFFFVVKKDAEALRLCQDYRYLNEGTIKNAYPLPLVSDLVDKLKGAQWFTKLDIRWGYHNIRIKEGDEWKAAFKTNRGLFEPMVMFFGLCNSPATFQAMMNEIFKDMIDKGWIVIYMDDILIFSGKCTDQQERTRRVLKWLEEHDLYLKPKKCRFDVQEVEFLGLIVRPNHLSMDPTKLAGIEDWPAPTNVKGVRSFLGFGNFYHRFIGHFADLVRPLNDLTRKDKVFEWSKECQTAFDVLKKKFGKSPVLLMPDPAKPFVIESDASKFATGAVLRQKDENGDWHPCGFISHSFDATQRNYEIYDRELLGIVHALETWRHYIQGSPHPITIFSNHKNLTFFKQAQKLNRRQAHWSLFLSQFNMKLIHVPRTQMVQSDALSRRSDHVVGEDTDNKNMILLPEELFVKVIDTELHSLLAESIMKDDLVKEAVRVIKENGTPPMKSSLSDWEFVDGLLFFNRRCYVPQNVELRREITRRYHESISTGHPGQFQTIELIRRDYWWPGMTTFIRNYVAGCTTCQQMKVNTHPTAPPLLPIKSTATRPFELVTTDFITDLPSTLH